LIMTIWTPKEMEKASLWDWKRDDAKIRDQNKALYFFEIRGITNLFLQNKCRNYLKRSNLWFDKQPLNHGNVPSHTSGKAISGQKACNSAKLSTACLIWQFHVSKTKNLENIQHNATMVQKWQWFPAMFLDMTETLECVYKPDCKFFEDNHIHRLVATYFLLT
jgi:hypothetical protein